MTPIRYNAYSSWSTETVSTDGAVGANFVPLGDFPCDEIVIYNPSTGVPLDIISAFQSDLSKFVTCEAPSGATIPVGGNAKEVMVRRHDGVPSATTVRYIWRKFRR